jgi:UDP-glucose 4-epimerase
MSDLADSKVFNATNDTITLHGVKTKDFLKEQSPNVPITREMGDNEAPLTNRKIKKLLGFVEQHDWKKYVKSG